MQCASQGMGFCAGGWENSLTLEITLSPLRQRLLPVFTRVLSPLLPRIQTCQLEQGRLSRWGIATLLYVPPGIAGSPWLQVLCGHVSQITQRNVSAVLLEKSAKHWRQLSMCVFVHPETWLKIMCGSYQIHILVNDMVLIFWFVWFINILNNSLNDT